MFAGTGKTKRKVVKKKKSVKRSWKRYGLVGRHNELASDDVLVLMRISLIVVFLCNSSVESTIESS